MVAYSNQSLKFSEPISRGNICMFSTDTDCNMLKNIWLRLVSLFLGLRCAQHAAFPLGASTIEKGRLCPRSAISELCAHPQSGAEPSCPAMQKTLAWPLIRATKAWLNVALSAWFLLKLHIKLRNRLAGSFYDSHTIQMLLENKMALRILLPINRTFGSMLCFLTYYVAGEPADRKGSIDLNVLQGHQD